MLDVAIGGLAAQPAVASVIAGATSAEQVEANVAAGGILGSPPRSDQRPIDVALKGSPSLPTRPQAGTGVVLGRRPLVPCVTPKVGREAVDGVDRRPARP